MMDIVKPIIRDWIVISSLIAYGPLFHLRVSDVMAITMWVLRSIVDQIVTYVELWHLLYITFPEKREGYGRHDDGT